MKDEAEYRDPFTPPLDWLSTSLMFLALILLFLDIIVGSSFGITFYFRLLVNLTIVSAISALLVQWYSYWLLAHRDNQFPVGTDLDKDLDHLPEQAQTSIETIRKKCWEKRRIALLYFELIVPCGALIFVFGLPVRGVLFWLDIAAVIFLIWKSQKDNQIALDEFTREGKHLLEIFPPQTAQGGS